MATSTDGLLYPGDVIDQSAAFGPQVTLTNLNNYLRQYVPRHRHELDHDRVLRQYRAYIDEYNQVGRGQTPETSAGNLRAFNAGVAGILPGLASDTVERITTAPPGQYFPPAAYGAGEAAGGAASLLPVGGGEVADTLKIANPVRRALLTGGSNAAINMGYTAAAHPAGEPWSPQDLGELGESAAGGMAFGGLLGGAGQLGRRLGRPAHPQLSPDQPVPEALRERVAHEISARIAAEHPQGDALHKPVMAEAAANLDRGATLQQTVHKVAGKFGVARHARSIVKRVAEALGTSPTSPETPAAGASVAAEAPGAHPTGGTEFPDLTSPEAPASIEEARAEHRLAAILEMHPELTDEEIKALGATVGADEHQLHAALVEAQARRQGGPTQMERVVPQAAGAPVTDHGTALNTTAPKPAPEAPAAGAAAPPAPAARPNPVMAMIQRLRRPPPRRIAPPQPTAKVPAPPSAGGAPPGPPLQTAPAAPPAAPAMPQPGPAPAPLKTPQEAVLDADYNWLENHLTEDGMNGLLQRIGKEKLGPPQVALILSSQHQVPVEVSPRLADAMFEHAKIPPDPNSPARHDWLIRFAEDKGMTDKKGSALRAVQRIAAAPAEGAPGVPPAGPPSPAAVAAHPQPSLITPAAPVAPQPLPGAAPGVMITPPHAGAPATLRIPPPGELHLSPQGMARVEQMVEEAARKGHTLSPAEVVSAIGGYEPERLARLGFNPLDQAALKQMALSPKTGPGIERPAGIRDDHLAEYATLTRPQLKTALNIVRAQLKRTPNGSPGQQEFLAREAALEHLIHHRPFEQSPVEPGPTTEVSHAAPEGQALHRPEHPGDAGLGAPVPPGAGGGVTHGLRPPQEGAPPQAGVQPVPELMPPIRGYFSEQAARDRLAKRQAERAGTIKLGTAGAGAQDFLEDLPDYMVLGAHKIRQMVALKGREVGATYADVGRSALDRFAPTFADWAREMIRSFPELAKAGTAKLKAIWGRAVTYAQHYATAAEARQRGEHPEWEVGKDSIRDQAYEAAYDDFDHMRTAEHSYLKMDALHPHPSETDLTGTSAMRKFLEGQGFQTREAREPGFTHVWNPDGTPHQSGPLSRDELRNLAGDVARKGRPPQAPIGLDEAQEIMRWYGIPEEHIRTFVNEVKSQYPNAKEFVIPEEQVKELGEMWARENPPLRSSEPMPHVPTGFQADLQAKMQGKSLAQLLAHIQARSPLQRAAATELSSRLSGADHKLSELPPAERPAPEAASSVLHTHDAWSRAVSWAHEYLRRNPASMAMNAFGGAGTAGGAASAIDLLDRAVRFGTITIEKAKAELPRILATTSETLNPYGARVRGAFEKLAGTLEDVKGKTRETAKGLFGSHTPDEIHDFLLWHYTRRRDRLIQQYHDNIAALPGAQAAATAAKAAATAAPTAANKTALRHAEKALEDIQAQLAHLEIKGKSGTYQDPTAVMTIPHLTPAQMTAFEASPAGQDMIRKWHRLQPWIEEQNRIAGQKTFLDMPTVPGITRAGEKGPWGTLESRLTGQAVTRPMRFDPATGQNVLLTSQKWDTPHAAERLLGGGEARLNRVGTTGMAEMYETDPLRWLETTIRRPSMRAARANFLHALQDEGYAVPADFDAEYKRVERKLANWPKLPDGSPADPAEHARWIDLKARFDAANPGDFIVNGQKVPGDSKTRARLEKMQVTGTYDFGHGRGEEPARLIRTSRSHLLGPNDVPHEIEGTEHFIVPEAVAKRLEDLRTHQQVWGAEGPTGRIIRDASAIPIDFALHMSLHFPWSLAGARHYERVLSDYRSLPPVPKSKEEWISRLGKIGPAAYPEAVMTVAHAVSDPEGQQIARMLRERGASRPYSFEGWDDAHDMLESFNSPKNRRERIAMGAKMVSEFAFADPLHPPTAAELAAVGIHEPWQQATVQALWGSHIKVQVAAARLYKDWAVFTHDPVASDPEALANGMAEFSRRYGNYSRALMSPQLRALRDWIDPFVGFQHRMMLTEIKTALGLHGLPMGDLGPGQRALVWGATLLNGAAGDALFAAMASHLIGAIYRNTTGKRPDNKHLQPGEVWTPYGVIPYSAYFPGPARGIQWLDGLLSGWNDPRARTWQDKLGRGLTAAAQREGNVGMQFLANPAIRTAFNLAGKESYIENVPGGGHQFADLTEPGLSTDPLQQKVASRVLATAANMTPGGRTIYRAVQNPLHLDELRNWRGVSTATGSPNPAAQLAWEFAPGLWPVPTKSEALRLTQEARANQPGGPALEEDRSGDSEVWFRRGMEAAQRGLTPAQVLNSGPVKGMPWLSVADTYGNGAEDARKRRQAIKAVVQGYRYFHKRLNQGNALMQGAQP